MKLHIKGFIPTSLLDWDGKIVSTLYTPYCNFRCPYCQNGGLILDPDELETIPWAVIKEHLVKNKGWVDGVCLTGGEPCIFHDLPQFIREVRALGVLVKLDTNGSFPKMLERLFQTKLVNYVALDIKASLDACAYARSVEIKSAHLVERVTQSIRLLMNSGVDYEFRTTVVPSLHTMEDIENIAKSIKGAKKYALQNFSNQGEILTEEFKKLKPYPIEKLEEMQKRVSSYVDKCVVRGS